MTVRYAVASITNVERTRFVVQRKDDTYVVPRATCLFGGAIEPGEHAHEAIVRELQEELGHDTASALQRAGLVIVRMDEHFYLFEAVVDDATLERIAAAPVYEGERAEIVDRDALLSEPWLDVMRPLVAGYISVLPGTQAGSSIEKSS